MNTFAEYVESNHKALAEIPKLDIERFTEGLSAVRFRDGTLWVAGNGGSAASASHAVADFGKTITSKGSSALRTIALSELIAMQTAFGNDDSFESAFALSLRNYAKKGDAVMILSVSGLSPNLLAASTLAIDMGLMLFSIVGVRGKDLAEKSDFAIIVGSDDYQVVENAQMSLIHWFVKVL